MKPARPFSIFSLHYASLLGSYIAADYLPAEIHKCFIHVRPRSCARFIIRCIPGLSYRQGFGPWNGAVFLQVALVADDDQWGERVVFDTNYLIVETGELIEGGEGRGVEDEEEALPGFYIKIAHGRCVRRREPRLAFRSDGWGRGEGLGVLGKA